MTLSLFGDAAQVYLDEHGDTDGQSDRGDDRGVAVSAGSVPFTVTKTSTAVDATFETNVTTSGISPQPSVATFDLGAVTRLVPVVHAATAPEPPPPCSTPHIFDGRI